jgi:hypothetical protein
MVGHRAVKPTKPTKVAKRSPMTFNEARTAIGRASMSVTTYGNIDDLVSHVNNPKNGYNTELTKKMAERALVSMNISPRGTINLRASS